MCPISVLRAYGVESLKFGPEYIIPKPLDPRVLLWVAAGGGRGGHGNRCGAQDIDLDEYREQLADPAGHGRAGAPLHHEQSARRRQGRKRIVFAEGEETKIMRAAARLVDEKDRAADPDRPAGRSSSEELDRLGLDCCAEVVDPEPFDQL